MLIINILVTLCSWTSSSRTPSKTCSFSCLRRRISGQPGANRFLRDIARDTTSTFHLLETFSGHQWSLLTQSWCQSGRALTRREASPLLSSDFSYYYYSYLVARRTTTTLGFGFGEVSSSIGRCRESNKSTTCPRRIEWRISGTKRSVGNTE